MSTLGGHQGRLEREKEKKRRASNYVYVTDFKSSLNRKGGRREVGVSSSVESVKRVG